MDLTRRAVLVATSMALVSSRPSSASDKFWRSGNYSFSDRQGGFTIRSVSGNGSKDNPTVIQLDLYSASPVTLMIRANDVPSGDNTAGDLATTALFLRMNVLNASKQAWIEFEFELQEIPGKASIFSDGLSFDQRQENQDEIRSTAFKQYSRDFEPYDRLRFTDGKMDPGQPADFQFPITDFTPRWEFYIVLDPQIPLG